MNIITCPTRKRHVGARKVFKGRGALLALALAWGSALPAQAQDRVLGLDISAWQGNISQTTWNNFRNIENRQFVFIRSSRGGTSGYYNQSDPNNTQGLNTLSQRYDDPYYIQNINRATTAGIYAGSYHFSRPDIIATTVNSGGIPNSGTNEADHFIEMAGPWMRPGYLVPVHDFEAGDGARTDSEMAQFCIDFSNRIYERMGIRPAIYINGNYAANILGQATVTQRNQLAQPAANQPSVVSPCYPILWSARWPNQSDPDSIDVQNTEPKDTYTAIYGPWDDYGVTHPWQFWQYASTLRLQSFNNGGSNLDADVARGGVEFLKDQLVPAVWMNDSSGSWNTLTNWNSGQTPIQPVAGPGQVAPVATGPLPTPRLPGASGSGVTSGQNDTVIIERPNANITVSLASGTHNIRKLYMRETLNISAGSLTVNYVPSPDSTTNGAQFSGPVTLSGSGSLTVHTLQVDATRTFTLSGGTLTFNTINLMPHSTTPAKMLVTGDVNFTARSNVTAIVARGAGTGNPGLVDLGSDTRSFNVGDGTNETDVSFDVPIINGKLIKTGNGTMRLTAGNPYGGGTTVSAGRLLVNNSTGSGTGSGAVTVNGGVLGGTGVISGAVTVNSGGTVAPGTVSALGTLTLNSVPTLNGTNFMRINRNGGSPLSDRIVLSGGTLNYGSTLVVSNVGAALIGGEVFTNFVAPAYTGVFSTAVLPPLSNGLNWYLGSLVTNGTIKVNRQPTANGITVTNTPGQLMQIPVASLVASATDPDGDSLAVGGFDSVTTNGILLSSDATYLYYSNNVNVADRFNYTITDGKGGSATGAVQIAEAPLPASFSLNASATNGVVSKNPDQGSYPAGSMVTLTATPDTGYSFFGWSGDAAGTNNPLAVTLTSNMTIVANFVSPQPARFQLIETLPDNRVRLVISGENGVDYAIDGSSNLLNWQQIGSLVSTGTVFEFVDDGASSNATRFYRTRR